MSSGATSFSAVLSRILAGLAGTSLVYAFTMKRVTSLRDVVYFNGHGSSHALIVLAAYVVLGGAVAMVVHRLRTRDGATTGTA